MAYVVLYVENADVVATFETQTDASDALNAFVEKHPQVRDEVAILEVDDAGHGIGPYVFAGDHAGLFA